MRGRLGSLEWPFGLRKLAETGVEEAFLWEDWRVLSAGEEGEG